MKELWCDGCCVPNPGEGGFGGIILEDDKKIIQYYGYQQQATNNQMEIVAVTTGLKYIEDDEDVIIYSDSQYVVYTMTKSWKKNKNHEYWHDLQKEINRLNIVQFKWIKGHAGIELNELSDSLSETGIRLKRNGFKSYQ